MKIYEQGSFEGLMVGKDNIHISILQFADDTLLFCKDNDSMLITLRKTVELFEWILGQKVNWEK